MKTRFHCFTRWPGRAARAVIVLLLAGCGGSGTDSNNPDNAVNNPASPVTISLTASPATINSGDTTTLTWSTSNATSCKASGAWSGDKPLAGSETSGSLVNTTNIFTLDCTGPLGRNSQSTLVTIANNSVNLGLDFPGSNGTINTMRFKFTNPLPAYPATYIWRAWPRQQNGYYTAFFWGNDDGGGTLNTFLWTSNGGADSYYGAHPYPDVPPDGSTHQWEISIEQQDFVNGPVVYNRWYTQALRVWVGSDGRKHHEFYWDLPNTDANHRVIRISDASWGNVNPPVPTLTWGDAPWNPGKEVWDGILRGIQIYTSALSLADILSEVRTPLSTAAGSASIWYLNLNPTPGDIADQSGKSHDPVWVGSERPAQWTGP